MDRDHIDRRRKVREAEHAYVVCLPEQLVQDMDVDRPLRDDSHTDAKQSPVLCVRKLVAGLVVQALQRG